MSLRSIVLVILSVSLGANAQPRTVTVSVEHSEELNSLTAHAFDQELTRLIAPAEIKLRIDMDGNASDVADMPGWSIRGAFKGNCTTNMMQLPRIEMASKVLGSAPVSNDHVLPYFTVDCDRIGKMLQPALQSLSIPFRARVLGRAMAKVAAHELYHILAQTTEHDISGIAKSQLSFEDLLDGDFALSASSLLRIKSTPVDALATGPHVDLAALEWMQR